MTEFLSGLVNCHCFNRHLFFQQVSGVLKLHSSSLFYHSFHVFMPLADYLIYFPLHAVKCSIIYSPFDGKTTVE